MDELIEATKGPLNTKNSVPGANHRRGAFSALKGTRTPNLLIRSQMLYPLSYERMSRYWDAYKLTTVFGTRQSEWPWPLSQEWWCFLVEGEYFLVCRHFPCESWW